MLETEIKKLIVAVEANTAARLGNAPAAAAPAATAPAATAPAAAPAAAAPAAAAAAAPDPLASLGAETAEVDFKELTTKLLAFGKVLGRNAVMTLIGEYGAVDLPGLQKDPSKYAEIVAKADAQLAAAPAK